MKIYSGFFMNSGDHVTYDYNPGNCRLPERINKGDAVTVEVYGRYDDSEVSCYLVRVHLADGRVLDKQLGKTTLLHITLWTAPGVPPVESGLRATKNVMSIKKIPTFLIPAKAGFFEK